MVLRTWETRQRQWNLSAMRWLDPVTRWLALDPIGGTAAFDDAMAAMDGAATANIAKDMEVANVAANVAAAAAADAPTDNAPTDVLV